MRLIKLLLFVSLISILLFACDDSGSDEENEYYPMLEIEVDNEYDLGFAVGSRFSEEIHYSLELNADLLSTMEQLISLDSVYFYENMLLAANDQQPDQVAELQGMSDGSGAEFRKIFIFNVLGEILALYNGLQNQNIEIPENLPLGCSDVLFKNQDSIFLAHNEDGFAGLKDHMYIVKAKITGKPEFISFCYPALLMGIGPVVNDAGIIISNNFIEGGAGDPAGVPVYFVNRKLIEFSSIQQITDYLDTKRVVNYLNCNIVSKDENRIVSIEMASNQYSLHEVDGLYPHTNHLVHPDMLSFPVNEDPSTLERYQTLQQMISEFENNLQDVNLESMHSFLNAVAAEPDPNGGLTTGATLSSSIFDLQNMVWKLYFSNPNDNQYQIIEF